MKIYSLIKISGNSKAILSVTLIDILDCMPNGDWMSWSILHLQAIGEINRYGSILELEQRIQKEELGLIMEWHSLVELAGCFYQVIEILLIADKAKSNLKRYPSDADMYHNCSTVIELVDSSYWLIKTDNIEFENNLIRKLNGEIGAF